jgi:shikimate kinase
MAMAFAVAGTKLPGMVINNPEVVSKTFPEFWEVLDTVKDTQRPENIVLIGMRGSGKSTVGELLAQALGKQFVDMDTLIVEKAGQTIPQIVEQHGWDHFRDLESSIAKEVASQKGLIIATGGGAILREANVSALRQHGKLVLLSAEPTTLAARIEDDDNRPALTEQATLLGELEDVWQQRRDLYEQIADISVLTDECAPEIICEEIVQKLEAQS